VVPEYVFYLLAISLKTCIISVDLRKALVTLFPVQQILSNLNQVAKSTEDILRYHKIGFDTKDIGNKNI